MSVVKSKRSKPKLGVLTKEHVDKCLEAWEAHAKQGNTHNLVLSMRRFYNNLWKDGKQHV